MGVIPTILMLACESERAYTRGLLIGVSSCSVRKAIVPVAGAGTRLFPLTKSQPKEMLPVGRKPVVQHVVEELCSAGIEQILLITGRNKNAIEAHFQAGVEPDGGLGTDGSNRVLYTRQDVPTGVADAVAMGREFAAGETVVVAFGDTILSSTGLIDRLIAAHRESEASCTFAVEEVRPEDVSRYGVVEIYKKGDRFFASDLVEKPEPSYAPSNLAVVPRYVFEPSIFDTIAATSTGRGGERWLTDAIVNLISASCPVRVVPLDPGEQRYDIGNFGSYYRAFIDFALDDLEHGEAIRRYVRDLDGLV